MMITSSHLRIMITFYVFSWSSSLLTSGNIDHRQCVGLMVPEGRDSVSRWQLMEGNEIKWGSNVWKRQLLPQVAEQGLNECLKDHRMQWRWWGTDWERNNGMNCKWWWAERKENGKPSTRIRITISIIFTESMSEDESWSLVSAPPNRNHPFHRLLPEKIAIFWGMLFKLIMLLKNFCNKRKVNLLFLTSCLMRMEKKKKEILIICYVRQPVMMRIGTRDPATRHSVMDFSSSLL